MTKQNRGTHMDWSDRVNVSKTDNGVHLDFSNVDRDQFLNDLRNYSSNDPIECGTGDNRAYITFGQSGNTATGSSDRTAR